MADESTGNDGPLDLSGLGSFDFTPAWAKGDPGDKSKYSRYESRYAGGEESRGDRRVPPRPHGNGGGMRQHGGGGADRRDQNGRRGERRERIREKPLAVDIRILPDQKELGTLARLLQSKHTAYALKQLANLFLDNPSACILRISNRKDSAEPVVFHKCKVCGYTTVSAEELAAHLPAAHLCDYYDTRVEECEPPKGVFPCVAKCGVTGELLGPPNLHGYDMTVREMMRTRCPGMSEAEYRSRIEMVHDQEIVEQWRAAATKKTVYMRKGEEAAVERAAAEAFFRASIAPGLAESSDSVEITAAAAMQSPCRPLVYACRDALAQERRFPASLFFALRGAFRHRKLKFFRANDARGPEFVVAQDFVPLDVAHAIPELAALVEYVGTHPCATQAETVAALAGDDAAKAADVRKTLVWLIEKGNLVGYYNGVLALPAEHPKYNPPRNRKPENEKK